MTEEEEQDSSGFEIQDAKDHEEEIKTPLKIPNLGTESVSRDVQEVETVVFGKLEKASRDMGVLFERDIEREDKGSDGTLQDLKQMKDRAVRLGIELTRTLVEFSLPPVHPSQIMQQVLFKGWILRRSCEEDSAVFYLMDFLLYIAEEIAEDVIEADAKKLREDEDLGEDGVSGDKKIGVELLVRFSKVISGLQCIASYLQQPKPATILKRSQLAGAYRCLYICEEHLKAAKMALNELKESSGQRTVKAFSKKKMEFEINRCWNEGFWEYVSTAWFFRFLTRFPHVVYALSKLFTIDWDRLMAPRRRRIRFATNSP